MRNFILIWIAVILSFIPGVLWRINDSLENIHKALLMHPVKSMVEAERIYTIQKVESTQDSAVEWDIDYGCDIDLDTGIVSKHGKDCHAYTNPKAECVWKIVSGKPKDTP